LFYKITHAAEKKKKTGEEEEENRASALCDDLRGNLLLFILNRVVEICLHQN
jgi:hypothetical protein